MLSNDVTIRERVRACVAKHPDWTDRRVSRAVKGATAAMAADARGPQPKAAILAACPRHPQYRAIRPPQVSCEACQRLWAARGHGRSATPHGGISRAEFMAVYDPTTKARMALKAAVGTIERGRFYKDHELRRTSGCADPGLWRMLANDPAEGFTRYQFRMADQVWWSDPKSVAELLQTHPKAKAVA